MKRSASKTHSSSQMWTELVVDGNNVHSIMNNIKWVTCLSPFFEIQFLPLKISTINSGLYCSDMIITFRSALTDLCPESLKACPLRLFCTQIRRLEQSVHNALQTHISLCLLVQLMWERNTPPYTAVSNSAANKQHCIHKQKTKPQKLTMHSCEKVFVPFPTVKVFLHISHKLFRSSNKCYYTEIP